MQRRSYFSVIIVVASTFFIASFTNAQESAEADERPQLEELMIQRRDVLLQLVKTLEMKFSQGLCRVDSVVAARAQLLDAELELATTKDARLKILHKQIKNLRELEDSLKIRHQAGQVPSDTLLSARAARLKAEIALARENE